jgi:hypothetical protein
MDRPHKAYPRSELKHEDHSTPPEAVFYGAIFS